VNAAAHAATMEDAVAPSATMPPGAVRAATTRAVSAPVAGERGDGPPTVEPGHGDEPPGAPLEVVVMAGGSADRFGRMVSALVNNTPVALYEVLVGEQRAYPVGPAVTARGPVVLRFRPRNPARGVDGLVVEQVVALVGGVARVLDVRVAG
jgi:hypothetical protein